MTQPRPDHEFVNCDDETLGDYTCAHARKLCHRCLKPREHHAQPLIGHPYLPAIGTDGCVVVIRYYRDGKLEGSRLCAQPRDRHQPAEPKPFMDYSLEDAAMLREETAGQDVGEPPNAGPFFDPQQQRCKQCGRADGLNAMVPDAMWERIRGGLNVLCLWCMDAEAERQGIEGTVILHFAGRALFSGLDYQDGLRDGKGQGRAEGLREGLEMAARWLEKNWTSLPGLAHAIRSLLPSALASER